MSELLSIGFSPCPNDTFIFYGMIHGEISSGKVSCGEPFLEDVETLNSWALEARLDITKLSFHALGHVLDHYCVLSAGSALGRGCGPLLVAKNAMDAQSLENCRIAIPGKYTTAALLLRMFLPQCTNIVEMRFETIMEAIRQGEVDAGVIIHESRFTYQQEGMVALQDLGQWWEDISGMPIPLGCIAAKRSLGEERIRAIDQLIHQSVNYAFSHPGACLPYIRQHAQEMDDEVVQNHIGLYVNDYSRNLGKEGFAAIEQFLERGRAVKALPESKLPLALENCG